MLFCTWDRAPWKRVHVYRVSRIVLQRHSKVSTLVLGQGSSVSLPIWHSKVSTSFKNDSSHGIRLASILVSSQTLFTFSALVDATRMTGDFDGRPSCKFTLKGTNMHLVGWKLMELENFLSEYWRKIRSWLNTNWEIDNCKKCINNLLLAGKF